MSLITRCPACATMFKVVPDQLRISAGWVRCGHCQEVFDAAAYMLPYSESVRLQAPPPPAPGPVAPLPVPASEPVPEPAPPPASLPASRDEPSRPRFVPPGAAFVWRPAAGTPAAASDTDTAADAGQDHAFLPSPHADTLLAPMTGEAAPVAARTMAPAVSVASLLLASATGTPAAPWDIDHAPRAEAEGEPEPADPRGVQAAPEAAATAVAPDPAAARDPEPEPEPDPEPEPTAELAAGPEPEPSPEAAAATAPEAPPAAPSFVAAARRRAFWSSRPMRAALWSLLTLLVLGLALQATLSRRDWLAAHAPGLTPTLELLCQPWACQVRPYRQLEAIVIDSSAFNRSGTDSFRFSVTLRNTADLPVATPALELTLTDAADQLLLRRVIGAAELGAPPALAARGEFSASQGLSVADSASPSSIVGYRLVAFYP